MSRVAQHWKLFWCFLFWLSWRNYICCRNFVRVCKLNHEGRKTLYLDQLVVWEWSVVVLTTKDLQLIKEANDGPWLHKLTMSHYIRDSIPCEYLECDLVVLLEGMKPDVRKWIYVATRHGWLHSLKVRLVEKMFATKFKELTTTRFWSS